MELIYKWMPFLVPRINFISKRAGHRCLDFGCGSGLVIRQNYAVRPDLEYHAVDVQDFSSSLPEYVSFKKIASNLLPYPDEYFDIITSNHVLEHIDNIGGVLPELKRVLKKGENIYIEVPNERSLWGKSSRIFSGTIHFHDDPTHLQPYSQKELIDISRAAGFKVVKSGISRNWLHFICSPMLFVMGILKPHKLYYMHARNSLIGWSSFVILEKPIHD